MLGCQRVEIDRARAPRAAAGQRDARVSETREKRAEHIDRGAHRPHEIVVRLVGHHAGRVHQQEMSLADDADAEAPEQRRQRSHVAEDGDAQRRRISFEESADFQPVDARKHEIQYDKIR